jgi:hypothetical protein
LVPKPFKFPLCNWNLPPWLSGREAPSPQINMVWWCQAVVAFLVGLVHWAGDKEVKASPFKAWEGPQKCWRSAQTETERTPKLLGILLSKQAATQQTQVQRLSPVNKGGLLYIPFRAGYRNGGGGVQLVPYIITCYFMAVLTSGARWPFSGLQVTFPNSGFPLFHCSTQ